MAYVLFTHLVLFTEKTEMDKRVFCVISLCTLALNCCLASSNQAKIDSYVDAIIADANRQVLDNQQEPLPLRNFTFKIAKTGTDFMRYLLEGNITFKNNNAFSNTYFVKKHMIWLIHGKTMTRIY